MNTDRAKVEAIFEPFITEYDDHMVLKISNGDTYQEVMNSVVQLLQEVRIDENNHYLVEMDETAKETDDYPSAYNINYTAFLDRINQLKEGEK